MSFTDLYFYPAILVLFTIVVFTQLILKKKEALSNILTKFFLLCFSYFAIYLYDYRFCLCIAIVTLITYAGALEIEKAGEKQRKYIVIFSVTLLVAILGLFKYFNFFMSSVMWAIGKNWNIIHIILPVGISFYIFSAIGYLLDIFWGNTLVEHSFLDMALYLSFFPKLVCGPIVAGRDFLPQLKENRRITLPNIEKGIQIFVFGLFKKIVLADHLAVFVDGVYAVPEAYGTFSIWLAVFSYYLQLYFDFSGYSDMAIGISKMLGYDIRKNFNLPFVARNISEFWDRWHISLTMWLNEYIFNPVAI